MCSSSSGSHHRSSLSCLLIRHPQPVLAFQCLLSFYRVLRSPPDIHYLNVDLSVTFSCPLRPTTYYFNVRLPSFSCLLHYQTVTISTFTAWGHFHVFFSNLQRLFRHSSVLIFIYYYVHLSSFSRVIIHNQFQRSSVVVSLCCIPPSSHRCTSLNHGMGSGVSSIIQILSQPLVCF